MWAIGSDRVLRVFGPRLANQNVIYLLDRSRQKARSAIAPPGFQVRRCIAINDIPTNFWSALRASQPNTPREEFIINFSKHSTFWLGTLEGVPACCAWSLRGRDLEQWYIPLQQDDLVIWSMITWVGFRGIGLACNIMQHIALAEGNDEADIYLYTKEWNFSAQRSAEKAGFQRLAVKPNS